MSDFPASVPSSVQKTVLTTLGVNQGFSNNNGPAGQTMATNVWPAANRTIFSPVVVEVPFLIYKMAWVNGSTVTGSTNVDVGIFELDGTLLLSAGTTTQTGTSVAQFVDVTDTWLSPGTYQFGMTCSNNTSAFHSVVGTATAQGLRISGVQQMAAAAPFTSNANPAVFANPASGYVPLIAATGNSVSA